MEKMTDMKMSKAEKKKDMEVCCGSNSGPDYPWGLSINLDEAALNKLGITELPDAGAECDVMAVGKVTSVSSSASDGDTRRRVEIQITNLRVTFVDTDDAKERFAKGYKKVRG